MDYRVGVRALLISACVIVVVGSRVGLGFDAQIDVMTPNSISYDLAPIEVRITVGLGREKPSYRVCDIDKVVLQSGVVEGTSAEFTFTPPRYGWYMIACESSGDGVARFVGVTPRFPKAHALDAGEIRGGWNDQAVHAFSGLMLDRTNTHWQGVEKAGEVVESAAQHGVTLLMQFENPNTCTPSHVREAVTKLKGRAKYYEIMNEPNFAMSPEKYAALVKQLVPIIKRADPAAKVMGPDTCGIDLGWYEAFYLLGGGKLLDVISVHDYEGDEAIDPFHWVWKMSELRKIMARHGDDTKQVWQTERAIGGVRAKAFLGATQAIRITLERDLMELFGVSNEHNYHYYSNVTGYNDCPTFICSPSGPHPAMLACRTRWAMIADRTFKQRISFGSEGDKLFLGLLYRGRDGSTVTLRNLGTRDQGLSIGVTRGKSLELVDSFGNVETVPVQRGRAWVTLKQLPVYLRLAAGQSIEAPQIDLGDNLAPTALFKYAGETNSPQSRLTDGLMQVPHAGNPWGPVWQGSYRGEVFDEAPRALEMRFQRPREVGAVLVFGARADNPHSALLDYDLQYHDGKGWSTLEEVRSSCPASDALKTYLCTTVTWYQDTNCFINKLKRPVTTDRLRLVIRRITRGFLSDVEAERAAGIRVSSELLRLREIEIYGPSAALAFVGGAAADATPSVVAAAARGSGGTGLGENTQLKADGELLARWDDALTIRLREALADGRQPTLYLQTALTKVVITAVGEYGDITAICRGLELTIPWDRLTVNDKRLLALEVLREGAVDDHCIAAFYALASNNALVAREHLAKCGDLAEAVQAEFR